jgi:hypothetical protein
VAELLRALAGRRLLLAAKEAGAGSLLAGLVDSLAPAPGSLAVASAGAMGFFAGKPVDTLQLEAHALDVARADRILASVKPSVLLAGASAGASVEKILLRAAARAGVPSYSLVDHYWNLWQRFADERTAQRWVYLPERIFVPGEPCRQRMLSEGCPPERLEVFEHPALGAPTAPAGNRNEIRSRLRAALTITRSARVLLFVSEYRFPDDPLWHWEQPAQEDIDGLIRLLLEAARACGDCVVLIKLHPAQAAAPAAWTAGVPPALFRVVGAYPKRDLFGAVDAAVGLNSMLLLEAALSGVPAYSYHLSRTTPATWLSTIRREIIELQEAAQMKEIICALPAQASRRLSGHGKGRRREGSPSAR